MLKQLASLARLDFSPQHRQPSAARLALATIASIAGSLAADALLVLIGEAIFPGTRGFVHFQFSDYAKLTVAGVIIACVAWPIVTRISWAPRWLFLRLAILVTLVLWLPDIWILHLGESADAVGVLMLMHLAIALVTYNLLVHLAPVRHAAGNHAAGNHAAGTRAAGTRAAGTRAAGERDAGERDALPASQPASRGQHRHAR